MLVTELMNLSVSHGTGDWSVNYINFWTKESLRNIRCKEYIRCCLLFFTKSVMRKAGIQMSSGSTWFVFPNGVPQKWILDFLLLCKVWLPAGVGNVRTVPAIAVHGPTDQTWWCKVLSPTLNIVNLCRRCPGHFNKHHPVLLPLEQHGCVELATESSFCSRGGLWLNPGCASSKC